LEILVDVMVRTFQIGCSILVVFLICILYKIRRMNQEKRNDAMRALQQFKKLKDKKWS
jgi:tellurite resistance protein TehA-like permease